MGRSADDPLFRNKGPAIGTSDSWKIWLIELMIGFSGVDGRLACLVSSALTTK